IDAGETTRDDAFCAHAILDPEAVMVVDDAKLDARFSNNPMVTGSPNVRFYAGAPLVTAEGFPLGALCVLDDKPRQLEPFQIEALRALSRQAGRLLELRRVSRKFSLQLREREWYEHALQQ